MPGKSHSICMGLTELECTCRPCKQIFPCRPRAHKYYFSASAASVTSSDCQATGMADQNNRKPIWKVNVKCGKTSEVTLGTPDVKSRPTRCQKGLQLQLMCCTPFQALVPRFQ